MPAAHATFRLSSNPNFPFRFIELPVSLEPARHSLQLGAAARSPGNSPRTSSTALS
jgi:hypothetical protein